MMTLEHKVELMVEKYRLFAKVNRELAIQHENKYGRGNDKFIAHTVKSEAYFEMAEELELYLSDKNTQ